MISYDDGNINQYSKTQTTCPNALGFYLTQFYGGFICSSTFPTSVSNSYAVFQVASLPPHYKREVRIEIYHLKQDKAKISFKIDNDANIDINFGNNDDRMNQACDNKNSDVVIQQGDHYYNHNYNTTAIPSDNLTTSLFSVIDQTSKDSSTSYLRIKAIQFNVLECNNACLTCSNATSCNTCDSKCSVYVAGSLCQITNSNYFLQEGKCVSDCTAPHFKINGKCTLITDCLAVTANQCSQCKSGLQVTSTTNYETQCQINCPNDYQIVSGVCVDKKAQLLGKYLLQGFYSTLFSSYEIIKLKIAYSNYLWINDYSSKFTRCSKYQLLGGYFSNRQTSLIASDTYTTTYKLVRVSFKWVLIDYTSTSNPTQISISILSSTSPSQSITLTGATKAQLCGLGQPEYVGDFQYDFSVPSSGNVILNILNSMTNISSALSSENELDNTNKIQYFGIRELSIFAYNCQQIFCQQCTNPAPAACTKCQTGYYLNNSVCTICLSICTECVNGNECTICNGGKVLNALKQCVCPSKQYLNSNNQCISCSNTTCDTCNPSDSTKCLTCLNSYLYQNSCVTTCPDTFFQNNLTNTCDSCITSCQKCTDGVSCTQCLSGTYLQPDGKSCLATCPTGYQSNGSTWKCLACSTNCDKCQLSTDQCTKCGNSTNLQGYVCKQNCDVTYYADNQVCKLCSTKYLNCQECNTSVCTLCYSTYFLSSDAQSCLTSCPVGYYQDTSTSVPKCTQCLTPICATCEPSPSLKCLTCTSTYFKQGDSCVLACDPNMFANAYRVCTICSSQFIGCNSCTATQCLTCIDTTQYLDTINNSCGLTCPSGTYQNTISGQNVCSQCSINCLTCVIANTQCTSCGSSMYLQGNTCQASCDVGFYPNSNGICTSCGSKFTNCGACTATGCTQCSNHTDFLVQTQNICLSTCPSGYAFVLNSIQNLCQKCLNTLCQVCSDADPSVCLVCYSNSSYSYLQGTTCSSDCSANEYPTTSIVTLPTSTISTKQCILCSDTFTGCQTCTNSICNSCIDTTQYLDVNTNTCVVSCNLGTIPLTSPINLCVQNCLLIGLQVQCINCHTDVSSNPICDLCEDTYFLYQNTCVSSCPIGTYPDNSNICKDCSTLFTGCTQCTQLSCQNCSNSYFFDSIDQQCEANCLYGANPISPSILCQTCTNPSCQSCSQTDLSVCLTCDSTALTPLMEGTNCVSSCDSQYYLVGSSCQRCDNTFSNCNTCDSNYCYGCEGNYWLSLDKKVCYQTCPDGQYGTTVNGIKVCQNCLNSRCLTCDSNDSQVCLTCDSTSTTKYLQNGQCNLQCNDQSYADANNICILCSSAFQNCGQCTYTQCLACQTGYNLDIQSNACLLTCPSGKYASSSNICQFCDQKIECTQCNPSKPSVCIQCSTGYYFMSGVCLSQCPDGYYPDVSNICQPCMQSNCLKCTINGCIECDDGNFYLDLITNLCVNTCSDGYFQNIDPNTGIKICQQCSNSLCKTCTVDGSCLSCYTTIEQQYLNGSVCVKTCPLYYDDINKICTNTCGSQQAPDPKTQICTICNNELYNNVCYLVCPIYTVEDPSNTQNCILCSAKYSNCTECDSNVCTKCSSSYYLYNGGCVTNCPSGKYKDLTSQQCVDICTESGYYADTNTSTCLQCNSSLCLQCVDKEDKCTACQIGQYLYTALNICFTICPSATYPDLFLQQCLPCSQPTCLSCLTATQCNSCLDNLNPDDSTCYAICPGNKLSYNNTCVTSCKIGSYLVNASNSCFDCPGGCQECTSSTTCTVCKTNYLNDATIPAIQICNKCIDGYAIISGECQQCSTNCLTCINSQSYCTSCQSNYNIDINNVCVTCSTNEYFNTSTQLCTQIQTGGATPKLIISNDISIYEDKVIISASIIFDEKIIILSQDWKLLLDDQYSSDYSIDYKIVQITKNLLTRQIVSNLATQLQAEDTNISLLIEINTSNDNNFKQLFVSFKNANYILDDKQFPLKIIDLVGDLPNYSNCQYPKVTQVSQVVSGIAAASQIMFTLGSPFFMLVSFFDILQLTNYLLYLNVNYPSTLYNVIKIFDFANFEVIPNYKNEHAKSPYKFRMEKIDTFIYSNLIQSIVLWSTSLIVFFISKLVIDNLSTSSNILVESFRKYHDLYIYQIIIGMSFLTYCDLLLAVFLQFYDISSISVSQVIGIVSAIALLSGIVFLNILTYNSIKIETNQLIYDKKIKSIYGFLYNGIELNKKKAFTNIMILLRKTIVIYQLVFNQENPINQTYVCCLSVGLETMVMLLLKPYKSLSVQRIQILSRLLMISSMILIIILAINDTLQNLSSNLQNLIQILISVQLLTIYAMQVSYLVLNLYQMLKKRYILKKSEQLV